MAGHSHWANISIKKGIIDKKRGKLFGKLSRAIIVAARHGGADTDTNLKLRYAIDKAKAASMPRDNIERAVKRGCGDTEGENYEDLTYEGYGPAGVAVLCDILTDNRNRTAGEIRKIFEVHGGNLGATGCVSWMFERKGMFLVPAANVTEERLFEVALENGADDVKLVGESFELTCEVPSFEGLKAGLEAARIAVDSAEIARVPANTVELDVDQARLMLELADALEENDDVQNVTANYNLSDEVL